jgi:hypothetical protein
MSQRALSGLFLFLAATPAFAAQVSTGDSAPDLGQLGESWRAAHGPNWRIEADEGTGFMQLLWGGRADAAFEPAQDEQFFDLALKAITETYALHGIETSTLVRVRTLHLPLGIIGSNDKMTVRFQQVVRGVPVEGGFVNALFDMQGRLLSIQSTGLPHVANFDVAPVIQGAKAVRQATAAFDNATGQRITTVGAPELVVDQFFDGERRVARLAWKVDVQSTGTDTQARGLTWFVDAANGAAYRSIESVHYFDVSGTINTNATPGLNPDIAGNPETAQPARFMRVTSGAVTTFTDTNGAFTLPGVNAPANITVTYNGTYCQTTNSAAPASKYTLTTPLSSASGNTVLMNPATPESVTAEANCFRCVSLAHDFVRAINPSDGMADFLATANVMVAGTCNAFWDGGSINFYPAGGGCVDSAYTTVINHELGHWLNSRYGTGNGADGMGEGNADVWSEYIYDTPTIGAGFSGGAIRTGTNTRAFCGDANPGCYGEVHSDGEPWMGAAWKIRTRLDTTNGNAAGDLIANSLFLGWMNGYNQTQIKTAIETQWLTLDDDDGNINSGTPHFTDIDSGFRDQAFPGVVLQQVSVAGLTVLPTTVNQVGPYTVNATIIANQSPPLTVTQLKYRINGGAFQTVNMTNTGGNGFTAPIPGVAAPAHVEYYVTATNSASQTSVAPNGGINVPLDFDVGIVHTLRTHNFDVGTDEGWTHGAYAGTDEWQRGDPAGKTGTGWADPQVAYTPTNCWGMDLGVTTTGSYGANSFTWLRSPNTNCTGAVGTHLRFKRWLSVQGSASDQARILVNGTQVYLNPTANLNDAAWIAQDIDISAIVDNNPTVQIEWQLQANGTTNYGGWNIDDVKVVWTEIPPAPCPSPVNFCSTSPNSIGTGAQMFWTGLPNVSINNFELIASGCPVGTSGIFFYGQNATLAPFGNGFRCIGSPIYRLSAVVTDFIGDAHFPVDVHGGPHAIQAGEAWRFQFWYRNPAGGGAGFNLSDGLLVTFCP